jgi:hypothetical protein
MSDRYDITVYYTETDWDQYSNVSTERQDERVLIVIDESGMNTVIPMANVRKVELVEADSSLPAAEVDEDDDEVLHTCDRCGRTGHRGFQRIKNATICTTKGCEARYRANLKRAREGK